MLCLLLLSVNDQAQQPPRAACHFSDTVGRVKDLGQPPTQRNNQLLEPFPQTAKQRKLIKQLPRRISHSCNFQKADTFFTATSIIIYHIHHGSFITAYRKEGCQTKNSENQRSEAGEGADGTRSPRAEKKEEQDPQRSCYGVSERDRKDNFQYPTSPRKSARTIAKQVGERHGTEVCHKSILRDTTSFYSFSGEKEIDALKNEKKKRVEMGLIDARAREIMSKKIPSNRLKKDQLIVLLKWHGIDTLNINNVRSKCLQKWLQVKDDAPPQARQSQQGKQLCSISGWQRIQTG